LSSAFFSFFRFFVIKKTNLSITVRWQFSYLSEKKNNILRQIKSFMPVILFVCLFLCVSSIIILFSMFVFTDYIHISSIFPYLLITSFFDFPLFCFCFKLFCSKSISVFCFVLCLIYLWEELCAKRGNKISLSSCYFLPNQTKPNPTGPVHKTKWSWSNMCYTDKEAEKPNFLIIDSWDNRSYL
jgi:hypothetical protein